MKLFIGNLPYDINQAEVQALFNQYGEVVEANLVIDQFSGRSKGFAFIEMAIVIMAWIGYDIGSPHPWVFAMLLQFRFIYGTWKEWKKE